jgi:hypothetical protein
MIEIGKKNGVHMRIKTMMFLALCFGLSQFGYARSPSGAKDQTQSDLSALQTDIRALQAEQQEILTVLIFRQD